jgi:hypothetical protein
MRLADFIEEDTTGIAEEWEGFARTLDVPAAEKSASVLRDHIQEILEAVAADMRTPQSREEQAEKAQGEAPVGPLDQAGEDHAGQRLASGFNLEQAASEFRALRASVVRRWEESGPPAAERRAGDLIRFNEALDQTLIESMKAYTRRLDECREQLLAILGHDLRTPIHAILMAAERMSRAKDLEAHHLASAARIAGSARRMGRLVGDLLDLTRARLGAGLPIARAPADLEVVCRQVLGEIEASHPGRMVRFASSGDLRGQWDEDRLAQVVSNLVANALHHGDAATPVVVSATAQDDWIAIGVHNDGLAIPPALLGRIFEPLVHADGEAHARSAGSLGLGLFIVREIATAHAGEVTVTSSDTEGTTFTVRLPREPPAQRAAAE